MLHEAQSGQHDGCPFINHDDARCGNRFRLGGLDQAFGVCFGSFNVCPMYHRISHEIEARASHEEDIASAQPAIVAGVGSDLAASTVECRPAAIATRIATPVATPGTTPVTTPITVGETDRLGGGPLPLRATGS